LFWNGYGTKRFLHPHPLLAVQLRVVAAHQLVDELVVVRVVAEHDVATDVVREALLVGERRRETTDVVVRLEDHEVLVAELTQAVAGARPVGPAPMMTIRGAVIVRATPGR
jgi:hypothetical protein